jgi:D-serine deaminase-like pyridoxal phosphate-dependent protein
VQWDQAATPIPFGQALTVLTSVVSRAAEDRVVVDAGWKSLSNDSGLPVPKAGDVVFAFAGDEHGKLTLPAGHKLAVGDKIELVPSHCDTTVNLYDSYICVRGGKVEAVWPVAARGKTQ